MVIISAIKRNRLTHWIKYKIQANKMSQWVKVLATEPDNLSLIPRTHTVKGENQLPHLIL